MKKRVSTGICQCTQDDFECDFCFEPYKGDGYTCIYACRDKDALGVPPANCKDTYPISKGYRKVEGTQCQGGLDLNPEEVRCPTSPSSVASTTKGGMSTGLVAIIAVVTIGAVFIVIAACIILAAKSSGFRGLVLQGYGRLPSSIRDPFKGTSFVRLDSVEDEEYKFL